MALWRLYYHVVFATEARRPCLDGPARRAAERMLAKKCEAIGCLLHVLHVQPEHAYIVLSIPPSKAVGAVVGQMKGSSSHGLRAELPPATNFAWQGGYGVFSFGERHLPDVVRYVRDQDRRHADGELWPGLESTDASADQPEAPRRFAVVVEPSG